MEKRCPEDAGGKHTMSEQDVAIKLAERTAWRTRINELEGQNNR